MNSPYARLLAFFVFFSALDGFGQEKTITAPTGTSYTYLIDSIDFLSVSKQDQLVIKEGVNCFSNSDSDTTKVNCLVNLIEECYDITIWPKYNRYLLNMILEKENESLNPSILRFYTLQKASCYVNEGYYFFETGNMKQALFFYKKGLDLHTQSDNKEGRAITLNNIGTLYQRLGDLDSSLYYLDQNLEVSQALNIEEDIAFALVNLGAIYKDQGNAIKALDYYLRALNLYEQIGNKRFMKETYSNLGVLFLMQEDNQTALSYFEKGLKLAYELDDPVQIARSLDLLAQHSSIIGNFDKALIYYRRSIDIYQHAGLKHDLALVLNNMGQIEDKMRHDSIALVYYKKCLAIWKKTKYKRGIAGSLVRIGQIELKQGDFKSAKANALRGTKLAKSIQNIQVISNSSEFMSEVYLAEGNFKKALEYHKLHVLMRDSLTNQQVKKETYKNKIQYEYDKKMALEQAKQEQKDALAAQEKLRFQLILAFSILIIIVLIALWTFYYKYQKTKLLNQQLANEKLGAELEHRNKELATFTLQFVQKNAFISDIKDFVQEALQTEDKALLLRKTERAINLALNSENEWDEFKMRFENVHKEFYEKLNINHPNLTASELRLAALLKLKLSSKEISALLNLTNRSIVTFRSRLRKKLNLSHEDNLYDFLENL